MALQVADQVPANQPSDLFCQQCQIKMHLNKKLEDTENALADLELKYQHLDEKNKLLKQEVKDGIASKSSLQQELQRCNDALFECKEDLGNTFSMLQEAKANAKSEIDHLKKELGNIIETNESNLQKYEVLRQKKIELEEELTIYRETNGVIQTTRSQETRTSGSGYDKTDISSDMDAEDSEAESEDHLDDFAYSSALKQATSQFLPINVGTERNHRSLEEELEALTDKLLYGEEEYAYETESVLTEDDTNHQSQTADAGKKRDCPTDDYSCKRQKMYEDQAVVHSNQDAASQRKYKFVVPTVFGGVDCVPLSSLYSYQGKNEPVNVLGVVVNILKDGSIEVSDVSQRRGVKTSVTLKQQAASSAVVISPGDCVLLRGFAVRFDKNTSHTLPSLHAPGETHNHQEAWCLWRTDSPECKKCQWKIECDETAQIHRLYQHWQWQMTLHGSSSFGFSC